MDTVPVCWTDIDAGWAVDAASDVCLPAPSRAGSTSKPTKADGIYIVRGILLSAGPLSIQGIGALASRGDVATNIRSDGGDVIALTQIKADSRH